MPAAALAAIQCVPGTGADSVNPLPMMPFGGTPSRTMKARLPGSMFRCRPQDHVVSKCPRRRSVRMSLPSSGQLQIDGLNANR